MIFIKYLIFLYCSFLPIFFKIMAFSEIVAYFLGENILYNSTVFNFKSNVFSG